MRALNCKHMAQLISLYVAGDLVGAREGEVAAHLAACEGCRRVAEEFSESGSLLTQACTPPEFGAEFYSEIRRAVLGEIRRKQVIPKPALFRRRWLYATAFAAVVIACGVMLHHFGSDRRKAAQDLALAPQVPGQPTSGQAKERNLSASVQSSDLPHSPSKSDRPSEMPRVQSHDVLAFGRPRGSSRTFETVRPPDASGTAQTALDKIAQVPGPSTRVGPSALESATSSGSSAASPLGLASAAQVSRIEIQTADPNIRIIWLTPSEFGESEGLNHDYDQQHVNRK